MQTKDDVAAALLQPWWIATDRLAFGGRRILGPFSCRDVALMVRDYVERSETPRTFWVDQGVPSCGNPPIHQNADR